MFREGKFLIPGVFLFLLGCWTIALALNYLVVVSSTHPIFLVRQAQNVFICCIPQRSQWSQTQKCWSNLSHIQHDCTSRVEDLKSNCGGGYLMTLCPLKSDECLWTGWLQLAIMLREIHWKQTFSLSWGALGLRALEGSASLPYFRLEERTELLHFLCFSSQYVVLVMQTNTSWLWTLNSRTYWVSSYMLSIHPHTHLLPLRSCPNSILLWLLSFLCLDVLS